MRTELDKVVALKSEEITSLQRDIELLNSKTEDSSELVAKLNAEISAKDVEIENIRQEVRFFSRTAKKK
ncbi:hypothetical protein COOONC_04375 [Cooperia oncophora]